MSSRIDQASFELSDCISSAVLASMPAVAVKYSLDDEQVDHAIALALTLQLAGAAVGIAQSAHQATPTDAAIEAEVTRVAQLIHRTLQEAFR